MSKQEEARSLLLKHKAERQQKEVLSQATVVNNNHVAGAWPAQDGSWPAANGPAVPAAASNGFGANGFDDNFSPDWSAGNALDGRAGTTRPHLDGDSGKHPSTLRYRGLFEFVARSEDELSFQPGDIILVFKDHAAEPGWLAGQIKDKVSCCLL